MLKAELDELIKLMDSGTVVGSRKTYFHKCGLGVDEYLANEEKVANLDSKVLTSNWSHTKELLAEPSGESQMRTRAVVVEPWAKEGELSKLNLEKEILDTTKDNCYMIVGMVNTRQ